MKKSVLLTAIICSFLALQTAIAQNPVTTLQHNGTTQTFYGQNSFVDAYNASINGDTLYLSTGYFTPPPSIAKGVKIIGAGHFPDSANVTKRTFILSPIYINQGADSLLLEGLYIDGNINYGGDPINYVKVFRCRFDGFIPYSNANSVKNNFSFEECFLRNIVFDNEVGDNLLIRHCIITDQIAYINGNALIDGNVFLLNGAPLLSVNSSVIQNNIFISISHFYFDAGNSINNNLFVRSSVDFGINSYSNNYLGIPQADIFINQSGNSIDYTHDYHLQHPELYIGTDGTQVGLYGGSIPFKDKGKPSNPQVISKNIATETDANGNLPISITVEAQDN